MAAVVSIPSSSAAAHASAAHASAAHASAAHASAAHASAASNPTGAAVPDCCICLEQCNKSTRKAATCPYCDTSVCRACTQTYLLQDQAVDHRCPNCRAVWNEDFLTGNLTGVFRHGPLRDHRAKILLDTEKARLPEFQERARAYLNAKEAQTAIADTYQKANAKLNRLRSEVLLLLRDLDKLEKQKSPLPTESKEALRKKIREKTALRDSAEPEFHVAAGNYHEFARVLGTYGRVQGGAAAEAAAAPKSHVWRSKCPATRCEGFLNEEFKCGLCEVQACKDCHEMIGGAGHFCNPDTVESVLAVQKEARPCPKCAALISKIDGCDQMWCTQCRTAFSWVTGNVEETVIHNPHYYQWMRETGQAIQRRDAAPGAAGGACGLLAVQRWLENKNHVNLPLYMEVRNAGHLENKLRYEEQSLRRHQDPENAASRCVRRLIGERDMDNEAWKAAIRKEQNTIDISRAAVQYHQMCVQVTNSILGKVLEIEHIPVEFNYQEVARCGEILAELRKFHEYCRQTARRLRLTYKAAYTVFYSPGKILHT